MLSRRASAVQYASRSPPPPSGGTEAGRGTVFRLPGHDSPTIVILDGVANHFVALHATCLLLGLLDGIEQARPFYSINVQILAPCAWVERISPVSIGYINVG